jgi:dolichol-phosphate mannosyltransferase
VAANLSRATGIRAGSLSEPAGPRQGLHSGRRSIAAFTQFGLVTAQLSVVVPVCNEAENVGPLAQEIHAALAPYAPSEIIFVDDGSTDDTVEALLAARGQGIPELRVIRHERRSGQSAAMCTGIRSARAEWIVTLDGDGQNDPADIPRLLAARQQHGAARLITGHRVARRDTWLRRISSRVANGVRGRLLGDRTLDTGCGIKLLHRDTFLELPRFDHMHRFLPALFQRAGAGIASVPVAHRPRTRGTSKYGLHNRLWVGIVDLFGVMWLIRRTTPRNNPREQ